MKIGVVGQVNSVATAEINRGAIAVGLTEGYDVVPARFPLSALNEANDWLGSQLAQVNAGAAATFVAGLRIDLNAVELRTPTEGTLTPKQESLLVAAKVRLGDRLVVSTYSGHFVGQSCGYPRCDPPLRGGTGIYYANGSSTQACTGGFIAKGRADQKLYLITAGHCVTDHHSVDWTSYFTNGSSHVVGPVSNYEFSANGDYAILQITDTTGWNPKPWVALWYDAHGHEWAFNIASDNYSMQGMWVCHSGAETGTSTCGEVTELGVTASYDGATVKNLGEASYCSAFGDSGASVFMGHIAYGIEVGGSAGKCDSIYQGVRAVEAAVNVDVLRTSASDWPEESGTSPTPSASLQIKPA